MEIDSPCVRNCCLDEEAVCLGCNRSIEEIIRWGDAAEKEKRRILDNAKVREKGRLKNKQKFL